MKRDMELIRLILLDAEDETEVDLSQFPSEQINYHKWLLLERGFIDGFSSSSTGGRDVIVKSLTWEGHEFLDDARDDKVWKEAMKQLGRHAGSASLDVLKALLATVATQMLTGGQHAP